MGKNITPDQIDNCFKGTSFIRGIGNVRMLLEANGQKIDNLGIGQAGHKLPKILKQKLEEANKSSNEYLPSPTGNLAASIVAKKMLFTHFTDKNGKIFAQIGNTPGTITPDFYVNQSNNKPNAKGVAVACNGASGFISFAIEFAVMKKYQDVIFVAPFFGPYEGHLKNINQLLEGTDKFLTNKIIDLNNHNYEWDKKALVQLKSYLEDSNGRSMIFLCSPNNPNGKSITIEEYKDIIRTVIATKTSSSPVFCMDEPYDFFTFKASSLSDHKNVSSTVKAEWRQHISITHALKEMVDSNEISKKQASDIIDSCLFINSTSKGVAAAKHGGGCIFSTNTELVQTIQSRVPTRDGPLRASGVLSIEYGMGYYAENTDMIKKLSEVYGEKVLSFKKWMNYETHKRDFKNDQGEAKVISYNSDGAIYLMLDVSGFLGKKIPPTESSSALLGYKEFHNQKPLFENAKDVALFLLFEKGISMVPGDGFGLSKVVGSGQIQHLRASVGESSLKILKAVADRFGQALDLVLQNNISLGGGKALSK